MTQPPAIDLWRDIISGCRTDLTQRGHSVVELDDWHSVWTFLNAERRSIPVQSRRVFRSKEFACPGAHAQALSDIEAKIRAGDDLAPHLSKRTKNLDDSDALLNHWGIFHLHMGETMGDDGFIARTDHLLFCRVTERSAYLIDVHPHKDAWPRTKLMRIIHDNWPETIAHWRAHGVTGGTLSDAEVAKLRNMNGNHLLSMPDGTVYFPPGGGTTSSGSNPLDTMAVDCLKKWSTTESQRIVRDWPSIREDATAAGVDLVAPVDLALWYNGADFIARVAERRYPIELLQPGEYCPAVTAEQIARISRNHV